MGLGLKKRQAEPISIDEENILWEKRYLGEQDPHTLLDTMFFLCGIHFALRSGEEHRSLRISQLEIKQDEKGSECLVYTENTSKNNQGGLSHRKIKPKQVTYYPNKKNPQRCLLRLLRVYLRHRPTECDDSFYLTPLRKLKGNVWYSKVPVGHNTLSKTVGRLCKKAGISGYKTNHSLRVTSATRLFQSGVDEQLIMSHTGHRSVDGVCTYKRESEQQKRSLSTVLNSASNGNPMPYGVEIQKKPKLDNGTENEYFIMTQQSQHTLEATKTINGATCTFNFNFSGCSAITINNFN